ncbi:MAG: ferrous iron transport protein A [Eubacteriaceae bacterium]|nr:ferrous iron transport protein A [Eubacteriaceae bacterium]
MKSMDQLKDGFSGKVVALQGNKRFINRITSIGIIPGSNFEVVQNPNRKPIIINSRDTMIAINNQDCKNILCEACQKCQRI